MTVPRYVGSTDAAVMKQLPRDLPGSSGLRLGSVVYQETSTAAPGTIIDQNPRPGQVVDIGTAVNLVIARGSTQQPPTPPPEKDWVFVPDLVKTRYRPADAERVLRAAGLAMKIVAVDNAKDVWVIRQSPEPNRRVRRGTTVTVYVARIIEKIQPQLLGAALNSSMH